MVEYYLHLCSKELTWLCLNGTWTSHRSLQELGSFKKLRVLQMKGCRDLKEVPSGLGILCKLIELDLLFCCSLESLPDEIGELKELQVLLLYNNYGLRSLPTSIGGLESLKILDIFNCYWLMNLPESLGRLTTGLSKLNLNRCSELKLRKGDQTSVILQHLIDGGCRTIYPMEKLLLKGRRLIRKFRPHVTEYWANRARDRYLSSKEMSRNRSGRTLVYQEPFVPPAQQLQAHSADIKKLYGSKLPSLVIFIMWTLMITNHMVQSTSMMQGRCWCHLRENADMLCMPITIRTVAGSNSVLSERLIQMKMHELSDLAPFGNVLSSHEDSSRGCKRSPISSKRWCTLYVPRQWTKEMLILIFAIESFSNLLNGWLQRVL